MQPHSIVVISLHSPKEKLWGELVDISNAGVTLRGIDLSSFDDFVSQILHPDGDRMGLHVALEIVGAMRGNDMKLTVDHPQNGRLFGAA